MLCLCYLVQIIVKYGVRPRFTGEDVDADDEWVIGVENPREFGKGIDELEAIEQASPSMPSGNEQMI